MAHHAIAHPALGSLQHTMKCLLIVSLDDGIISPLVSRIRQTTSLCALNVTVDASEAVDLANLPSSPSPPGNGEGAEVSRLNTAGSSLSMPEFVGRLISGANVVTILIDLRGHANELGLSCAFLAALEKSGFNGHLIYVSITGELLAQDEQSRKLREANPIHAAIETQLRNMSLRGGHRTTFTWTVLGRAATDTPLPGSLKLREGDSSAAVSPASTNSNTTIKNSDTRPSRQSSRASTGSDRASVTDIVEGIVCAIQDNGRTWTGRKIMLQTYSGRRVSFMNQTDWVSESTE